MFENWTGKEKKDHFRDIIFNSEKLKEELNLKIGYENGSYSVSYTMNFFTQYSIHPLYLNIINAILHQTYSTWIKQIYDKNYIEEKFIDIWIETLQYIFKSGGLK